MEKLDKILLAVVILMGLFGSSIYNLKNTYIKILFFIIGFILVAYLIKRDAYGSQIFEEKWLGSFMTILLLIVSTILIGIGIKDFFISGYRGAQVLIITLGLSCFIFVYYHIRKKTFK